MANTRRTDPVFDALGDPTRRTIFERLASRPQAVGELARGLPVSRPAVSQHLQVLKSAGLVLDRAEGTRRVYRIDPAGLGVIREWLDQFRDLALDAFRAEVEADSKETDGQRTDPDGSDESDRQGADPHEGSERDRQGADRERGQR